MALFPHKHALSAVLLHIGPGEDTAVHRDINAGRGNLHRSHRHADIEDGVGGPPADSLRHGEIVLVVGTGSLVGGDDSHGGCQGDGSDPGAIELDPGETVTCTFTNFPQPGTIIVAKVTDPSPDPTSTSFVFSPPTSMATIAPKPMTMAVSTIACGNGSAAPASSESTPKAWCCPQTAAPGGWHCPRCKARSAAPLQPNLERRVELRIEAAGLDLQQILLGNFTLYPVHLINDDFDQFQLAAVVFKNRNRLLNEIQLEVGIFDLLDDFKLNSCQPCASCIDLFFGDAGHGVAGQVGIGDEHRRRHLHEPQPGWI